MSHHSGDMSYHSAEFTTGGTGGSHGVIVTSGGGGSDLYGSQGMTVTSGGGGSASYGSHGMTVTSGGGGGASYSSSTTTTSYEGSSAGALSAIEASILRSTVPIEITETEEITVNGERGIWANRAEVINWKGMIPITEYKINEDANPEIITKQTSQAVTYMQEVAVRYLRPPTPPPPGEIVIKQECVSLTPPAPPLVIRQMPPRPCTPEPLIVREAPPKPPCTVGRKVITISGRRLPPAPRKVVIERLPPLPNKPQAILVERWLPYNAVKRRVIFQKDCDKEPTVVKPRNVIVQWQAPEVLVKKEFKYLGTIRANPAEYVAKYGDTLKAARDLPAFVLEIKNQEGIILAAEKRDDGRCVHELEGDVQLMKYVNLDREGLAEYREVLARMGVNYVGDAEVNAWIQRASQEMLARSQGHAAAASASAGGASYSAGYSTGGGASYSAGQSSGGSYSVSLSSGGHGTHSTHSVHAGHGEKN